MIMQTRRPKEVACACKCDTTVHLPVVDEADVEGRAARLQARHQRILKVTQQPAAGKRGGSSRMIGLGWEAAGQSA